MAKRSSYPPATPVLADTVSGTDDPSGTPLTRNFTFADVRTLLQSNLTTATITVAAANTAAIASTGYSLTGSDATSMIDLAGTWNTTGTPTALKLNITNTASNSASALLRLQVGGADRFKVSVDGSLTITGDRVISWSNSNSPGIIGGTNAIGFLIAGLKGFVTIWDGTNYFNGGGSQTTLGFHSNISPGASGTMDVRMWRDAADTLALRRTANAQAFRVYSTWTDASNGSWMTLDAGKTTASVNRIISNANGTGTIRPIAIDGFTKSGAPTATEIPAGTFGVFKDSGGGVVIAYNDGGSIVTAALT